MSLGGGGGGTTKNVTKVKLTPEQKDLIAASTPVLKDYVANPTMSPDYSGVAGFNGTQTEAQNMATGAAGQQNQLGQSAANANNFLLDPSILSADANPYLQSYIQSAIQPLTEQFKQSVLPGISSTAIGGGGLGGSRQGVAQGLAAGNLFDAIGNTTANIANQGYAQGLGAMTKGLALNPQTQQGLLTGAQTLGAVGDAQQGLQQQYLNESIQRYYADQNAQYNAAKEVAQLAGGLPGAGSTTTSGAGSSPSSSPIQGALGGASLGASVGGPYGAVAGGGLGALLSFL